MASKRKVTDAFKPHASVPRSARGALALATQPVDASASPVSSGGVVVAAAAPFSSDVTPAGPAATVAMSDTSQSDVRQPAPAASEELSPPVDSAAFAEPSAQPPAEPEAEAAGPGALVVASFTNRRGLRIPTR